VAHAGDAGTAGDGMQLAQLSRLRVKFHQDEKSFQTNSSGLNTGLSETSENGL
jgi:hypothetical protein